MKTTQYLVKDAATGKQIYTSYARRPSFSFRKTATCPVRWTTDSSGWYGNMERAKSIMSKRYGKEVMLEEAGEIEVFPV